MKLAIEEPQTSQGYLEAEVWLTQAGSAQATVSSATVRCGQGNVTAILGDGSRKAKLEPKDNLTPQPNLPQCLYLLFLGSEVLKGHSRNGFILFFDIDTSSRLKMACLAGCLSAVGSRSNQRH